ncbi:MAG: hypothetical protein O3B03_03270 [Proteobacteria bacterium]|nr:hypothetical protein [Pseudomonadota bacterium]MDA1332484.1 hypothetical protein [Pseudomonadota bacterium]
MAQQHEKFGDLRSCQKVLVNAIGQQTKQIRIGTGTGTALPRYYSSANFRFGADSYFAVLLMPGGM